MKRDHVKHEFTHHELDFALTMARAKEAFGVKTDAQLADALGMSSSGYANRKASRSIPFERLIPICHLRGIDLNQVFFGGDTVEPGQPALVVNDVPHVDELLLGKIIAGFFAEQGGAQPGDLEKFLVFGMRAAHLYNQATLRFPEGKARHEYLDAEIKFWVHIHRIASQDKAK